MQSSYPYHHSHHQMQAEPACVPNDPYAYYQHAQYDSQGGSTYFPLATYPVYDSNVFASPPLILQSFDYGLASTSDPQPAYGAHAYIPDLQYPTPAPIHAPTPVAAYPAILVNHVTDHSMSTSPYSSPCPPALAAAPSPAPAISEAAPRIIRLSPAPEDLGAQPPRTPGHADGQEEPQDTLGQYNTPQILFPTPSELLTDPDHGQSEAATSSPSDAGRSSLRRASRRETRESQAKAKGKARALSVGEPNKTENLRKSYFRSVASQVGFESTDPDTITSHDKKRHYLECLEQYIVYLHKLLGYSNVEPEPMLRVEQYAGLSSQAIRTLLIHMQSSTRELHSQVKEEEEKYFLAERSLFPRNDSHGTDGSLPSQLHATAFDRARRHSIANGMIPMSVGSHVPTHPPAPTVGMSAHVRNP
ncbi:hypothetical protein PHLGIDRAFT_258666 [Phlebiopsis gigantea 11061_1 CR5-6]|uniref:Uncharacterized protein n=1 Tax=Phlebiopsis gigantea (strain 11061_1 CR5-6) TaxID=745531 RepID=A0A0C3S7I0_PHLG1|nr:hypothetical protein PHLGIDRAFT_258666 [Phlebiopsis gigantea 11061_1 CR5-6]